MNKRIAAIEERLADIDFAIEKNTRLAKVIFKESVQLETDGFSRMGRALASKRK